MLGFSQLSRSGLLVEAVTFLDEAVAPDADLLAFGARPDAFGWSARSPALSPCALAPGVGSGADALARASDADGGDSSPRTTGAGSAAPEGGAFGGFVVAALTGAAGATRFGSGPAPLTEGRPADSGARDAATL